MTPDLIDYLTTLISPPLGTDGIPVLVMHSVDEWHPDQYEDGTVNGIIVQGTPSHAVSEAMMAKLKPGAHLLCMAPESQPTGHTGACNLEDAGFEIRDSILLITEPGRLHYVAKASRSEREAGIAGYVEPQQQDATRKEGDPGGDNPRNRGVHVRSNFHPTVKPIDLMEKLVEGAAQPVLDPFLGSGTTGVACLNRGLDFVGIEQSEDYFKIADARHRYADAAKAGWDRAEIISDVEPEEPEPVEMSLDDLFGF